MTINQLMALMKVVRGKKARLEIIQREVSTKERIYRDEVERETTPQYDPKVIDTIVAKYEKFLFEADAAIKQSNAITNVVISANIDDLLGPIS